MSIEAMTEETRDECLNHGNWNYGILPGYKNPVTAVITHRDHILPSYIDEHLNYRETPFQAAIDTLWGPNSDDVDPIPDVTIPSLHYAVGNDEYEFPEGELKYICHGLSAPFKWAEYSWTLALREAAADVLCPVLIKGAYSDVLVHEDYETEMREQFKAFARERRAEGKSRL